ncbi:TadE/TadG family type IV pilus assembly protein [Pimelobacter simplex]|nr:TadE/TadG family type IV pilus assembly protein [Pimelobacter simplex]UUW92488.1 pilus assembly protein [Pimelobacter simplex]UUW96316.1 pilus assembly protein [Pimelobacter simplex]
MVVIAPALLFGLMLIVQAGLYFHARNVAEQAAQEGAAEARAFDGDEASAKQRAMTFLGALGDRALTDRNVEVDRGAETATVTVSGDVISLVPGVSWSVSESASGPVERYVPPTGGQ